MGAAALMLSVSCRTLTAPPGYVSQGSGAAGRIEFPEGLSLEAQYSLLAWYGEQYGQEARLRAGEAFGLVHNALNDRAILLCGMAAQSLVGRYPDFVYIPPQGGIAFLYESLAGRQDFPEMEAMLARCRQTLEMHHTLEVPVQECRGFLAETTTGDENVLFAQWAAKHPSLEIASPDEQNLRLLERSLQAVALKARLTEAMDFAEESFQDGARAVQTLARLDQARQGLPEQPDLGVIGDEITLPRWNRLCEEAPRRLVEGVIRLWPRVGLERYEAAMSEAMQQWEKDLRLQKAVREKWMEGKKNLEAAFQARREAIARECAQAAENGDFVQAIHGLRERADRFAAGQGESWECYARLGYGEELVALLRKSAEGLLPAAREYYLARQRQFQAMGYPASVLALGRMLRELTGEEAASSRELCAQAEETLAHVPPFLRLTLGEFSGKEPGQGASWRRDLGFALAERLARWNAGRLVRLEGEGGQATLEWRLEEGELLEYEAGAVESQSRRTERRGYGEVRMEEGGDHAFLQPQWEESLETIQASRVGHARLRGMLRCGERSLPLELNAFYPKEFWQDNLLSSHVVDTLRCQDQRQLKPVTPRAPLRQERIWSTGEMLDFTRQNALQEYADLLMATLLKALPQELAQRILPPQEQAEETLRLAWTLEGADFSQEPALEVLRQEGIQRLRREGEQILLDGLSRQEETLP